MTEKELQLSIENVCFSSDGKNELYVDLECVGDTSPDYSGVNVDLYNGDKCMAKHQNKRIDLGHGFIYENGEVKEFESENAKEWFTHEECWEWVLQSLKKIYSDELADYEKS